MDFLSSSRPSDALLATAAPLAIWDVAKKQAERAPMIRFKVGAVIYGTGNTVISDGCSHPDVTYARAAASIHAERHALSRCGDERLLLGATCCIFTLNGRGGCSYSSRPCYSCAARLYKKGVERVIYAERISEYHWNIRTEHPEEMLTRAISVTGSFARQQRIPS